MTHDAESWSIDRVRDVVIRVAGTLADGHPRYATQLLDASRGADTEAEALLVMRSALVATRDVWETSAPDDVVAEAKAALKAGKRMSIDLE